LPYLHSGFTIVYAFIYTPLVTRLCSFTTTGTHPLLAESQPYILGILQEDIQRVSIPKAVVVAYIDSHCVERAEQVQTPEPESSWLAEAFQALQPGLGAVPSAVVPVSSSINVSRNRETLLFGVKVPKSYSLYRMHNVTVA
jgi:hypothetical protein